MIEESPVRRPFQLGAVAVTLAAASMAASALPAIAAPTAPPTTAKAPAAGGLPATPLPLGPADLPETRDTVELAPGVDLTTIVRGAATTTDGWQDRLLLPPDGQVGSTPDPTKATRALGSKQTAEAVAGQLRAAGFEPTLLPVNTPAFVGVPAGIVGYEVRLGHYAKQADLAPQEQQLKAAGFKYGGVWTAEDADSVNGPWRVYVLSVDPHTFDGHIASVMGTSVDVRTHLTTLAERYGALAGTNGSYGTAYGDTAGIHVADGQLLSEANNRRTGLILTDHGRKTSLRIDQLWTHLSVSSDDHAQTTLSGFNRHPGEILDCGGRPDDQPTSIPQHDVTCKNPNELVQFTSAFGANSFTGTTPGVEVTLNAAGTVTAVQESLGAAIPAGGSTVQGIGTGAEWLRQHAQVGRRLRFDERVTDSKGRTVPLRRGVSMIGAGPTLVRDGKEYVTAQTDGLVHVDGDPTFYDNWVVRRNGRTMIGTDARGRILMVAADGRNPGVSVGLTIGETAGVMRALGATSALNLDGGGSTAMVRGSELVNHPSDATGERFYADVLLLLPR